MYNSGRTVSVAKIMKSMGLRNLTETLDLENRQVELADVNRPALQLAGYYDFFEPKRIEIVGIVEYEYLKQKDHDVRVEMYKKFFSHDIPCVIYCRDLMPGEECIQIATEAGVPVLITARQTSEFMAELIYYLSEELAPMITIHGVLVDVYGEGLLIMGESGIGKSEAALELIRRGHRLVTDDVVEIRKLNEHTLIGSSPDITKHLIELRGIGIIDVKALYGVECVKDSQNIDLVIQLEDWKKENDYDRLGMNEAYIEFLGNKVVCHNLPIRPGRNLAVICETAAVNHRQKKMGYNAAEELYRRVQENMNKGNE